MNQIEVCHFFHKHFSQQKANVEAPKEQLLTFSIYRTTES